jgi:hypothetical protein
MVAPTIQNPQAIWQATRRPQRSPIYDEIKEPRKEPAAMEHVIPPCSHVRGLLKLRTLAPVSDESGKAWKSSCKFKGLTIRCIEGCQSRR